MKSAAMFAELINKTKKQREEAELFSASLGKVFGLELTDTQNGNEYAIQCPKCGKWLQIKSKALQQSQLEEHMLSHSSLVCPGLYLGSEDNSKEDLPSQGITHVVNAALQCKNMFEDKLAYVNFRLYDIDEQRIPIADAVAAIEDIISKDGIVFLHCIQGISRSGTMAVAYVMKSKGITLKEALAYVRERRSIVTPNRGFLYQLCQYEKSIYPDKEPSLKMVKYWKGEAPVFKDHPNP